MKRFLSIIVSTLITTTLMAQTDQQCLQQASNQQLIDELARRLGGSSGGGARAYLSGVCDEWNKLKLSLIRENTHEDTVDVTTRNSETCRYIKNSIRVPRYVYSMTVVAACTEWDELVRISISPRSGMIIFDRVRMPSQQACLDAMKEINESQ